jgi:transposase
MARKAMPIVLTPEERTAIQRWVRSRRTPQGLAQRARIVLEAAAGQPNEAIAQRWHLNLHTVGSWRRRFVAERLPGLQERPGRGRKPRYVETDAQRMLTATLTTPPESTHWSTRRLAAKVGVSHMTIHRLWRAFDLKPHQQRSFKFSADPRLEEKVLDVVGLYLHPPAHSIVLSLDAKTQIQALERTQPLLPLRPGSPARHTHDDVRHGTLDLFAALEVRRGNVIVSYHRRHRHQEVLVFLRRIERAYPEGEIHVIFDNASPHLVERVEQWFARRPRFHQHFTPTGASWLNQIEAWFSILSRRAIRRGSFGSVRQLRAAIERFLADWNQHPRPFIWVKTPEQILAKIRLP